ncbi:MAG: glycosyltransferase family 4 protein [Planctomycetes bacterium]|nr:glycosyltransferase family 4 protein [Planctomycetota bacterium]
MDPTIRTEPGVFPSPEAVEERNGDGAVSAPPHVNGYHSSRENGKQAARQETHQHNGQESPGETRPTLAVFCYEAPDSGLGRWVQQTIEALGRRHLRVHLFSRQSFGLAVPGVTEHPVGESHQGDLCEQVEEFSRRACNAFLQQFPGGGDPVTLLGYEWSAYGALSLLRGLRNASTILSLHSLERQRGDLRSEVSLRIEAVELAGLREAGTILIQNPAAGEVAKYWVPECAARIVPSRQMFPLHQFAGQVDPGHIKGRYQVGPVDPTIVYVGDLSERYGPDLLIKALPPVLKNHPQTRLVIVGDGPLYWPLRVFTRYLLLEHAVRLAGSLEGQPLVELMQAADIIAVPSREATPWWPILAGWAARRPVVATHHAAAALLEHEQDSVLCYPNPNSCVWGLERVLFDPELGRTLAHHGRQKLEERFGWNILAEQMEELMGVKQAR